MLFGIGADQATKWLAQTYLSFTQSISVIPNVLFFQLVHNSGAAYGIFQGKTRFLLIVSILVLVLLVGWRKKIITSVYSRWAWCFLMLGTTGNFIDRFFCGYVIDFIDIRLFPLFNLADVYIDIGVAFFVLESVMLYLERHKST